MSKGLYRNLKSGDIFAIETDGGGKVVSTAGPLLTKDLDPNELDFDDYFTDEVRAKIADFAVISRRDYLEILRENGFIIQTTQKHLF
jgi:hypothetical protein